MAGIRLGYGLSENEELLEKMAQVTQPGIFLLWQKWQGLLP